MPHNLYLYSALVQSRDVDKSSPVKIKEANWYFFIEASLAVFVGFLINVCVVSVFAAGFYRITNKEFVKINFRYFPRNVLISILIYS